MYSTLLALGLAFTSAQQTEDTQRAIDYVRKSEGKIRFDEKAPGKPVVSVDL
jgi:hypothetical protein